MLHLSKPTDSQLKACAAFYAAAFGAPPWNEESDEAALAAYFDAFCHSDARCCWLLMDGGVPVGIALCTVVPCPDAPFLRIEDICIDPRVQRQGYGSAFLKLLRQSARDLGCDCIMLATQRGYPAHDFYRKNGFTEIDSVQMYTDIQ